MSSFSHATRPSLPATIRRALLCGLILSSGLIARASALDYKRDILPIFREKCFDCHEGAGGEKVKGDLRLDDPAHFLNRFAKNDVVIPGDWDASYLFVTLTLERGAKGAMPPKGKGEALKPDEIMKVAQWIHEGARIEGEQGEPGARELDPGKILTFKDGALVTERFGTESDDPPAKETPAPKQREWVNSEGKKISAAFGGVEGDNVILLRGDGKAFKYPLAKLSAQSQKDVRDFESQARE